ncbi:UNVERIFIED_CONTAM: hypothetical protein K2H54_023673 [Gekko kuhli]
MCIVCQQSVGEKDGDINEDKTPSPVHGLPAHSAATILACQDLRVSPSLLQIKREEEEPTSSLQSCSYPGLLESPINPVLSSGRGIQTQDQRLPKRRPIQGKRYQCSSDGCRMAFQSMRELLDHLTVHYRPTQSLEGKTFCCSTLGCAETFSGMHDLMEHTKIHCKPNRYFKCENCMLHFRTHRSLFKHLHVCSDNRSPSLALLEEKPAFPTTSGPEKEPPGKLLSQLPKFQSVIQHNRLRPYLPVQGLPVSNAVWKKSQGHSSNSRIVWEHTRGRYRCLQCSYSVLSRKEMTQHLEDHRKNALPTGRLEGEMDFGVSLPSFHSKMPPEMDTSLYSPL